MSKPPPETEQQRRERVARISRQIEEHCRERGVRLPAQDYSN
jgi:hypothetical protein